MALLGRQIFRFSLSPSDQGIRVRYPSGIYRYFALGLAGAWQLQG